MIVFIILVQLFIKILLKIYIDISKNSNTLNNSGLEDKLKKTASFKQVREYTITNYSWGTHPLLKFKRQSLKNYYEKMLNTCTETRLIRITKRNTETNILKQPIRNNKINKNRT